MTQPRDRHILEYALCAQRTSAPQSAILCSLWRRRLALSFQPSRRGGGQFALSTGSLIAVVSMDRLLSYFLAQFICRGTMTFTTASGASFTCGDGPGEPVAVRFLTTDAERRILLNPELALGEVYMEGTF